MRYFRKKQIHASCSTMSSNDEWVVQEITRQDFVNFNGLEKTISKKHGISVIYVEADKKFYNDEYHTFADQNTIEKYVNETYLRHGWTINHPFVDRALKSHWKDEDDANTARRIKEGYVIPRWEKGLPVATYQGGFSDVVFKDEYLQNYLQGGGCHGYIGHSARKPQTDAYLESQWLKHNPDHSLLAMWLTSTGGRHFADWARRHRRKNLKAYIKEQISNLIAQALSYREKENV